jgi:hypothetical protein
MTNRNRVTIKGRSDVALSLSGARAWLRAARLTPVMRVFLIIALSFCAAEVAKPQDQSPPGVFDPFDRWSGPISAEFERARLDNFAIALRENADWFGYILVTGKSINRGDAQRRATRMKNYVVCYRQIPWDRIIAVAYGSDSESRVMLQPLSKSALATPFFESLRRLPEPTMTHCNRVRFSASQRRHSGAT